MTENPGASPAAMAGGTSALPPLPWWTWALPFPVFMLGNGLSLQFQVGGNLSLWYLPVSLGMVLVQWWGPRVLAGFFLSAMACAGFWGLERAWLWPLHALPETLEIGLSWWLFARVCRGKAWLSDLANTWRFLLLGIVLPCLAGGILDQGLMVLLENMPPGRIWEPFQSKFVLKILGAFAVTVPTLLFATSAMEKRGLSLTRGAHPRPALVLSGRFDRMPVYEAVAVFAGLLALSLSVSLERHWYVYGIFLIWAALRFGIGLAAIGAAWTTFLAVLLPAMLSGGYADAWNAQADFRKANLNLATLCFAALVVGRALSDVFQEIETRKLAEAGLKASEERFRQMAENIHEIFFLLERDTRTMLYVSPIAQSILGIPLDEIVNKPFAIDDHLHPEDRERIGFFVEGAWYKRPFNEDLRFLRPDGGTRWLRLRSVLIPGPDGETYRVAGVASDITEYKQAQEESRSHQRSLVKADKLNSLGMMVSGVAHEINNPNNLIMLNSDVLDTFWKHMRPLIREHAGRNPDWKLAGIPYAIAEGKYETLLGGIAGGAKRIKRIVDNLKDFSRIDGGDLSENVSAEKVLESSLAFLESLVRKSTDNLSVKHGENLPHIRGNFQKLEQVMVNLVTNACQSLENRSKAIRITTWHENDRTTVAIRVEDEGRGIPRAMLDKVTDPFFTTRRETGGAGLGLSVSYGIVREHDGALAFKSEENCGTTVEIRLPAHPGRPGGTLR